MNNWGFLFWFMLTICCSAPIDWLFYSTGDEGKRLDRECLHYEKRFFCRGIDEHRLLPCIHGVPWQFFRLAQDKVTTDHLLSWNIPFHDIEQYALYLSSDMSSNALDRFLCNCTSNRIGSACQYELPPRQISLVNMVESQLSRFLVRKNKTLMCLTDDINCYSGAVCLEWRQVCDRIVDCRDEVDENDCELLELNECDVDEFQCRNGMCIPLEFLFDGTIDCMDSSDEQEVATIFNIFNRCPKKSAWQCDERLCRKDQFSCGDGQCVDWSTVLHLRNGCENFRHIAYRCEMVDLLLTTSTGVCWKGKSTISRIELSCQSALRRLLVGQSRKVALSDIIERCPDLIQYPEQHILSPVITMFFNKSRIVSFYDVHKQNFYDHLPKTTPDIVCFNGALHCNGIRRNLSRKHCINYEEFEALASYPFYPVSFLFCQLAKTGFQQNTTDARYALFDECVLTPF